MNLATSGRTSAHIAESPAWPLVRLLLSIDGTAGAAGSQILAEVLATGAQWPDGIAVDLAVTLLQGSVLWPPLYESPLEATVLVVDGGDVITHDDDSATPIGEATVVWDDSPRMVGDDLQPPGWRLNSYRAL